MMTGAKPQLAGIKSFQFSSMPSLERRERVVVGRRSGLGKAPQCDIPNYFSLHRCFRHTIKRMSLNLRIGRTEGRSMSLIVASSFLFKKMRQSPVVRTEFCWMQAISLMPHVKHRYKNTPSEPVCFSLPICVCILPRSNG